MSRRTAITAAHLHTPFTARRPGARLALATAATAVAAFAWGVPASAQAQALTSAAAAMPSAPTPWQGPAAEARQGALRVGLTQRTQIVYEPRPWQPATPLPVDYTVRKPQPSLGLEFKNANKDQSVKSLLRVQLSGDSMLQFRPRGGGMTVTYKSQF